MRLLSKTIESIRADGLYVTLRLVVRYPFRRAHLVIRRSREKRQWAAILAEQTVEQRFTKIYETGAWGGRHSASGVGSSLASTINVRRALPQIFADFGVKRFLDAPCGDFLWMQDVLRHSSVLYCGADIVRPMIDANTARYASASVRFIHLNLVTDALPNADLMLCRDCLFHLSFSDTLAVLSNFAAANIRYLLTTTHINDVDFVNVDIRSGDFRLMDLMAPPYSFSNKPLLSIDDWVDPEPKKRLCLWDREQVLAAVSRLRSEMSQFQTALSDKAPG